MSTAEGREDRRIYKVVVNEEGQYSIWPADRENARGLRDAGKTGTKEECVAYIEEARTRANPSSQRRAAEEEMANE